MFGSFWNYREVEVAIKAPLEPQPQDTGGSDQQWGFTRYQEPEDTAPEKVHSPQVWAEEQTQTTK